MKTRYSKMHIIGRCGNQLFEYFFLLYLYHNKIITGAIVDFEEGVNNELDNFILDSNFSLITGDVKPSCLQSIGLFIYNLPQFMFKIFKKIRLAKGPIYRRKENHFLSNFLLLFGIVTDGLTDKKIMSLKSKSYFILGYFQRDTFINSFSQDQICSFLSLKNTSFDYSMLSNNYVCVHIRRGDYLDKAIRQIFYVCDDSYFIKAISLIKQMVNNPIFVIYSDDIEWCKKSGLFSDKDIYDDGSKTATEVMIQMSRCHNFIISNSTFSFWAQYINKNKHGYIIAPKKWYGDNTPNPRFYDDWILI